jgi:hypothetical protein
MEKYNKYFIYIVLTFLIFGGCYSFKGGSVPSHLKTIAIPTFNDQSGFGEAGLREALTNKTIERFLQDNSLGLTDQRNSDTILECTIISVPDVPLVVAAGEAVTKRKITITIKAVFKDLKFKKTIYDKQLSNWGEYDTSGGPESRKEALTTAIDKLSEDILLETVSGW